MHYSHGPMGRRSRAARRGRTVAAVAFGLVVTAFTVVCSVQIMQQVWAPEGTPTDRDCRSGVLTLIAALSRARDGAAAQLGEREDLARFRAALQPEWSTLPTLRERCQQDRTARSALEAVVRLRYTEEDGLRLEAGEPSRLRRRLRQLREELEKPAP